MNPALPQAIFRINTDNAFRAAALEVFHFQAAHNPVYREYLSRLGVDAGRIAKIEEIPFLPAGFFRTHRVLCGSMEPELVFESSGTTTTTPSRHHVADASLYRSSLSRTFRQFYGPPEKYCFLALLPSYLERKGSSLVYMLDHLIRQSGHSDSGFYLGRLDGLAGMLERRNGDRHPTLLLGVSFALADLAEKYPVDLGDHIIVMETGGMKGRRKEMVRSELHSLLSDAFSLSTIHSEYGMTELLSQAYSSGEGLFRCPPWMRVMARDPNDPLTILTHPEDDLRGDPEKIPVKGGLNIIDLANLYSCAFIATDDLGKVHEDGSFEVTGRFDHSDVRGCNLMVP
ncbi:MAG TPA: acyl transferase [Bacteroides sp.]|nr:acyl transferase [Bacteroides sp.]